MKVFGTSAISRFEYVNIAFNNTLLSAFPSRMHSRNDLSAVVPKQNGDAVGGADADADIGEVGG